MNSENTMRNFEDEYRKYAKSSAPDLWDRIEAGVDALIAKENNPVSNENEQAEEAQAGKTVSIASSERYHDHNETVKSETDKGTGRPEKENRSEERPVPGGKKKTVHFSRYMGIAAAVACGLIAVTATGIMTSSLKSNSAESASYAPAAPSAQYEAAAEAPAADEAPMAETAEAEAQAYEEYEEAAPEESYDDSMAEAAEAAYTGGDETESEAVEYAASQEADGNTYTNGEADMKNRSAAAAEAETMDDNVMMAEEAMADESAYEESAKKYDSESQTLSAGTYVSESERADGLNAGRKAAKAAGSEKDADKLRQKEQTLSVEFDSLTEENGRLICTLKVADPGITKHKEGEIISASVNEPIKSKVSRMYNKSKASGGGTCVVTLLPQDSGFIITDIRSELK